MFSLHFNLCNPAINNRGVSVGKRKFFARSREDIADIRNYHAGNYCIPVFTSCILMQRNFFWVQFRTRCETSNSPFNNFYHHLHVYSGHYKENTNIYKGAGIHSQPKSKFAIKAFSLRNRIWSSFSPERLARWSVATRPPYEKCLSKFVELGGGVRCCLATLMKAFLRLSLGKYANQGCVPSTFSKWIHHGLVGGLPAMVVVRRVCLLAFLCQLG